MKKAVIDQMMLWMIIFISFVTMLFMVMDYYVVIKTKDTSDLLSNYGARMKALGKNDDIIVDGLNTIKSDYFATVNSGDLLCDTSDTGGYKIKLTANISIVNRFLSADEKIYSYSSAFNEVNSDDISCTLNLRKSE